MSITCQICNIEFEKIIPWQHLKKHNISTIEYKKVHGAVYSQDTLKKMSEKIPHNKGIKVIDPEQLNRIRIATALREEKFKRNEFTRGAPRTLEQKQLLSEKTKYYASVNKDEMKNRAKKAIETKIRNGYDFGKNMRGKKHSPETKQKILEKTAESRQQQQLTTNIDRLSRLDSINLTLLSDIAESTLHLKCNLCSTEFSIGRQYITPARVDRLTCPTCIPRIIRKSTGELELYEFIKSLCPDAISGYRSHYHSKEIDVFIPSLQLGFEFNGLYWHSESVLVSNNRKPTADYIKQQEFAKLGIRLIEIFEDEWRNSQEIVKSRIANILKATNTVIYARRCTVQEINSKDAAAFCKQHHIMGAGRSNIRFGLMYAGELVSVMTFSNNNISRKSSTWEINRFASKINISVVGGASRLFSAFLKLINPQEVISYADNRWSTGELYYQLGFEKMNDGTPNYWYVQPNMIHRIHRFTLRKNKEDDQSLTEYENRLKQGYVRIWDCGSSKWKWSATK